MNNQTLVPIVDAIIEKGDKIILIRRNIQPFKNRLVIPGGKVEYGETVEAAVLREAKEETGLEIKLEEILGVYSNPERDPRWHSIGIVFVAEPIRGKIKSSLEGIPNWYCLDEIDFNTLGFDHDKILKDYVKWKKSKGTFWSSK